MKIPTEPYLEQRRRWPRSGRHILAHFDEASVVVYQAYRPEIGHYAGRHQAFGGEFSFSRMSWIKPNFLWMMYRSGWGTKPGQEVTLAVRIQRAGFDQILRDAVHSSFVGEVYGDHAAWREAVAGSSVRLQWDPDHDPDGGKTERRAIQLGLRDQVLARYARDWIVEIEDVSDFVAEQRRHALDAASYAQLLTPREEVYPVADADVAARLGVGGS
jgi:hypothetical protein